MGEVGSYLYAVCRDLAQPDLDAVRGLQGQPLRVLEHRGLVAVVSDVDLEEFGEAGLRDNLQDLRWLEEVARTHDAVVFAAASSAPTAPLRLATICLTDDGVRERLDRWRDPLVETLEQVAGRQEWSVKAFVVPADSGAQHPETTVRGTGTGAAPGAGAAYLRRRREETTQAERDLVAAEHLADALHASLCAQAAAGLRLAVQDQRLSGHQGTMILNGAYLVDEDETAGFRDAVEALGQAHPAARVELNGPWPAYSFVTVGEQ